MPPPELRAGPGSLPQAFTITPMALSGLKRPNLGEASFAGTAALPTSSAVLPHGGGGEHGCRRGFLSSRPDSPGIGRGS